MDENEIRTHADKIMDVVNKCVKSKRELTSDETIEVMQRGASLLVGTLQNFARMATAMEAIAEGSKRERQRL